MRATYDSQLLRLTIIYRQERVYSLQRPDCTAEHFPNKRGRILAQLFELTC